MRASRRWRDWQPPELSVEAAQIAGGSPGPELTKPPKSHSEPFLSVLSAPTPGASERSSYGCWNSQRLAVC